MPESPIDESFAALSRFFVGDDTVEHTLQRVADLTEAAIAPADFVGLTLLVEGRRRTAVFTDPQSPEIDQAQYDTGEGPCLKAFDTQQEVMVPSTLADGPFPAFRKAAAAHGILSTLSLPLTAVDTTVGAMNLYSRQEHGFGSADRQAAARFAGHAAVVLANAQAYWQARDLNMRLSEAMKNRAVIEQAKGILMGAQRCTADEAFELLVAASQRENMKLRLIAQRIVDSTSKQDGGGGPLPRPAKPPASGSDEG